jgi:hypothetical protein
MICNDILFSDHIISQMFKRSISLKEVKFTGHCIYLSLKILKQEIGSW